ncbi:MAG TPA: hypothetical protein VJ652_15105 [Noviherbaspirillum sp.]|nr:hypothetical protein [Noviherbaspirillum sp.]
MTPSQEADLLRTVARMSERLELLTGERGDATKAKSALRRTELRPLASLTLQSKQVSAAPTQADFNALQKDVANIMEALTRLSNLAGNADLPKAL